jgi:hypothetical protein
MSAVVSAKIIPTGKHPRMVAAYEVSGLYSDISGFFILSAFYR